ncbi:MAG: isoaspartyl peptidase/L-asparaginase [Pseudomonadota bacterium]|nr:isoaspartyl peptidase/L-asparaginase [Pseudomonadota bacterium]
MLADGHDTLDAALHITTVQEDDPDDRSTGLGGLPTEDGHVELEAACLHGPTLRGAAVSGVSRVRNAAQLAHAAMNHSEWPLLVGQNARKFAESRGFPQEDLLTERSRKAWLAWKQIQQTSASWGPGVFDPSETAFGVHDRFMPSSQRDLNALVRRMESLTINAGLGPQWSWRTAYDALFPSAEPLYVATLNDKNELSAAATTSGLPWRPAGIIGDVALIGSGCFLDPDVGSAGTSGNDHGNLKMAGARAIVDNLRSGMSPEDAGMDVLRRIARWYNFDVQALRFVEVVFYVLRRDGAYAGVSLWQGDKTGHVRQFSIHDGERRTEDCRFLLEGSPANAGRTMSRSGA